MTILEMTLCGFCSMRSNMKKTGIYPGTFDPITVGHRDIITRGLKLVDRLIIAVAEDIPKTPIFSSAERVSLVKKDIAALPKKDRDRVEVKAFRGLLVEFAGKQDSAIIIRGLRAISDFEYEFQMACMNSRLNDDIETVFLPASENTHFISSRFVKEIARLKGDISSFVSADAAKKLKVYYREVRPNRETKRAMLAIKARKNLKETSIKELKKL